MKKGYLLIGYKQLKPTCFFCGKSMLMNTKQNSGALGAAWMRVLATRELLWLIDKHPEVIPYIRAHRAEEAKEILLQEFKETSHSGFNFLECLLKLGLLTQTELKELLESKLPMLIESENIDFAIKSLKEMGATYGFKAFAEAYANKLAKLHKENHEATYKQKLLLLKETDPYAFLEEIFFSGYGFFPRLRQQCSANPDKVPDLGELAFEVASTQWQKWKAEKNIITIGTKENIKGAINAILTRQEHKKREAAFVIALWYVITRYCKKIPETISRIPGHTFKDVALRTLGSYVADILPPDHQDAPTYQQTVIDMLQRLWDNQYTQGIRDPLATAYMWYITFINTLREAAYDEEASVKNVIQCLPRRMETSWDIYGYQYIAVEGLKLLPKTKLARAARAAVASLPEGSVKEGNMVNYILYLFGKRDPLAI